MSNHDLHYTPEVRRKMSASARDAWRRRRAAGYVSQRKVRAAAMDLYAACRDVLGQFEAGYFVRNTDSDGCSDWAIKATGPLLALASMKAALAKADGHARR